jgi:hypothetical protein
MSQEKWPKVLKVTRKKCNNPNCHWKRASGWEWSEEVTMPLYADNEPHTVATCNHCGEGLDLETAYYDRRE